MMLNWLELPALFWRILQRVQISLRKFHTFQTCYLFRKISTTKTPEKSWSIYFPTWFTRNFAWKVIRIHVTSFLSEKTWFCLLIGFVCQTWIWSKSDKPINFPESSSGRVIPQGLFRYWKLSLKFGQWIFCHDKFLTGFSRVVLSYNRQASFWTESTSTWTYILCNIRNHQLLTLGILVNIALQSIRVAYHVTCRERDGIREQTDPCVCHQL